MSTSKCVHDTMFWASRTSSREPSSSVGSPNIAGSGAGRSRYSAPIGPWWVTIAMNFAIPAPIPLRW
jgi:hypothetical protein